MTTLASSRQPASFSMIGATRKRFELHTVLCITQQPSTTLVVLHPTHGVSRGATAVGIGGNTPSARLTRIVRDIVNMKLTYTSFAQDKKPLRLTQDKDYRRLLSEKPQSIGRGTQSQQLFNAHPDPSRTESIYVIIVKSHGPSRIRIWGHL